MRTLFIDGTWVEPATEAGRDVIDPSRLTVLDRVADGSPSDVDRAVRAADAARSGWFGLPQSERIARLRECLARVASDADGLARLESRETGAPLRETRWGVQRLLERAERQFAAPSPVEGVVAVLGAAPSPLVAWIDGIVPRLAGGATVVLKPAASSPLTSLRLADLCASLPSGVLNVVTGGADTGRSMVVHPGVRSVFFVGSTSSLTDVEALAADRPVVAVVGTNDPLIVCADADIEMTVRVAASARLLRSGQQCRAPRRFYVDRAVANGFVTALHEFVGLLDVDDPEKATTEIGPLVSRDGARKVERQIANLMRAGATLVMGGFRFRPSGLPGHFMQTTVLTNVPHARHSVENAIDGPVFTVTPFDDLSAAVDMANDGARTRTATVFTRDPARAERLADALRVRTVWTNDPLAGSSDVGPCDGLVAETDEPTVDRPGIGGVEAIHSRSWWLAPRGS